MLEVRDRSPLSVAYEVDDSGCRIGHSAYLGAQGADELPWEGTTAELAEELRRSLERHGADFLTGTAELVRQVAREQAERPTGFRALVAAQDDIGDGEQEEREGR